MCKRFKSYDIIKAIQCPRLNAAVEYNQCGICADYRGGLNGKSVLGRIQSGLDHSQRVITCAYGEKEAARKTFMAVRCPKSGQVYLAACLACRDHRDQNGAQIECYWEPEEMTG